MDLKADGEVSESVKSDLSQQTFAKAGIFKRYDFWFQINLFFFNRITPWVDNWDL